MGHVQSILDSMKSKQVQASPAAPVDADLQDLPGLRRESKITEEQLVKQKQLYNQRLRQLQEGTKELKTLQGGKKKLQKEHLKILKREMKRTLTQIGAYTQEEALNGFKEAQNGN